MPDPFDQLIPDAQTFYAALNTNNNRDWWLENKATYDETLKPPALVLLDHIAQVIGPEIGFPIKTKLFRPHRDVRFSKDKTPYQTHLHMLLSVEAGKRQNPAYFFGIDIDRVRIGAGVMGFEKEVLLDYRTAIDTGGFVEQIATLTRAGYTTGEPSLKRVPAPFAKDHPKGDLLRRKSLSFWKDIDPTAGVLGQIEAGFRALAPLQEELLDLL